MNSQSRPIICLPLICSFIFHFTFTQVCTFQVGSFNYAMDKLIFEDEFVPTKEEAVRSILDYDIEIYPLVPEDKQYSALNMNYSVAGFQLVLARKVSLKRKFIKVSLIR